VYVVKPRSDVLAERRRRISLAASCCSGDGEQFLIGQILNAFLNLSGGQLNVGGRLAEHPVEQSTDGVNVAAFGHRNQLLRDLDQIALGDGLEQVVAQLLGLPVQRIAGGKLVAGCEPAVVGAAVNPVGFGGLSMSTASPSLKGSAGYRSRNERIRNLRSG
jgi:hypothetical protein